MWTTNIQEEISEIKLVKELVLNFDKNNSQLHLTTCLPGVRCGTDLIVRTSLTEEVSPVSSRMGSTSVSVLSLVFTESCCSQSRTHTCRTSPGHLTLAHATTYTCRTGPDHRTQTHLPDRPTSENTPAGPAQITTHLSDRPTSPHTCRTGPRHHTPAGPAHVTTHTCRTGPRHNTHLPVRCTSPYISIRRHSNAHWGGDQQPLAKRAARQALDARLGI